jgi:O-methyltransferase involved in polyketide biosynthesis
MYLRESAVRDTLHTISSIAAPGSSLVMDFATGALLEVMAWLSWHPIHKFTTGWGEPWIFGVPDGKESEFFRESGLALREIMTFSGKEAAKRYFTRTDGRRLGIGRPERNEAGNLSFWSRLSITFQMFGPMVRMLRSRSKGFALAELVVI